MNAVPEEIGREDIEQKFRELQSDVVGTVGAEVKSYAMAAGAVLVIGRLLGACGPADETLPTDRREGTAAIGTMVPAHRRPGRRARRPRGPGGTGG